MTTIDNNVLAALQQGSTTITRVTPELDEARARIVELENEVDGLRTDFESFNTYINNVADNAGWCEDFDHVLTDHNSRMTRYQMIARAREFEVSYRVRATYSASMTITARSSEDARERFDDYADETLLEQARHDDNYPDIEVTDVEA